MSWNSSGWHNVYHFNSHIKNQCEVISAENYSDTIFNVPEISGVSSYAYSVIMQQKDSTVQFNSSSNTTRFVWDFHTEGTYWGELPSASVNNGYGKFKLKKYVFTAFFDYGQINIEFRVHDTDPSGKIVYRENVRSFYFWDYFFVIPFANIVPSDNYKTLVFVSDGGVEHRARRWSSSIKSWTIKVPQLLEEKYGDEIRRMISISYGKYEDFLFFDPLQDYIIETINYSGSGVTLSHMIMPHSENVYDDNGDPYENYSIDYENKIITFDANGVYHIRYLPLFRVRIDSDTIEIPYHDYIPEVIDEFELPLVEVKV
ncbi:MAG: hypothetical protein ACTSRP_01990 [Candidatus Helarchaeota archaeon]